MDRDGGVEAEDQLDDEVHVHEALVVVNARVHRVDVEGEVERDGQDLDDDQGHRQDVNRDSEDGVGDDDIEHLADGVFKEAPLGQVEFLEPVALLFELLDFAAQVHREVELQGPFVALLLLQQEQLALDALVPVVGVLGLRYPIGREVVDHGLEVLRL